MAFRVTSWAWAEAMTRLAAMPASSDGNMRRDFIVLPGWLKSRGQRPRALAPCGGRRGRPGDGGEPAHDTLDLRQAPFHRPKRAGYLSARGSVRALSPESRRLRFRRRPAA